MHKKFLYNISKKENIKKHRKNSMFSVCSLFFGMLFSCSASCVVAMDIEIKEEGLLSAMQPFQFPPLQFPSLQAHSLAGLSERFQQEIPIEAMILFQVQTKKEIIESIYLSHLRSLKNPEILTKNQLIIGDFGAGSGNLTFGFLKALEHYTLDNYIDFSCLDIHVYTFEVDPLKKEDFNKRFCRYENYKNLKYKSLDNIQNKNEFNIFLNALKSEEDVKQKGGGAKKEKTVFIMSNPPFLKKTSRLFETYFPTQKIKTTQTTLKDWELPGFLDSIRTVIDLNLCNAHYLLLVPSNIEKSKRDEKLACSSKNFFDAIDHLDGGVFELKRHKKWSPFAEINTRLFHNIYIFGNQSILDPLTYQKSTNQYLEYDLFKYIPSQKWKEFRDNYEHEKRKLFDAFKDNIFENSYMQTPPSFYKGKSDLPLFVFKRTNKTLLLHLSKDRAVNQKLFSFLEEERPKNFGRKRIRPKDEYDDSVFFLPRQDMPASFIEKDKDKKNDKLNKNLKKKHLFYVHSINVKDSKNRWGLFFSHHSTTLNLVDVINFRPMKFEFDEDFDKINFMVLSKYHSILHKRFVKNSVLMSEEEALGLSAYLNAKKIQKVLMPRNDISKPFLVLKNLNSLPMPSLEKIKSVGKNLIPYIDLDFDKFILKTYDFGDHFFENGPERPLFQEEPVIKQEPIIEKQEWFVQAQQPPVFQERPIIQQTSFVSGQEIIRKIFNIYIDVYDKKIDEESNRIKNKNSSCAADVSCKKEEKSSCPLD